MPEVVEEVLGTRVARLTPVLRRLLLAVALSEGLRAAQIAVIGGPFALDDAVDAGLLILDGDRVRASHPLLAAAARSRAGSRERRELHLELARSRRRRGAAGAASGARRRRARRAALRHALRGRRCGCVARCRAGGCLARRACASRSPQPTRPSAATGCFSSRSISRSQATSSALSAFLEGELDSLPAGPHRVRALLLLSEGGANVSNDDGLRYLERALVESGNDPLLRAPVLAKLSSNASAIRVRRLSDAEAWARGGTRRVARRPGGRARGAREPELGAQPARQADRRSVRAFPRRVGHGSLPRRIAGSRRRPASRLARRGRIGRASSSPRCCGSPASAASRSRTPCSAYICASSSCAPGDGLRRTSCSTSGRSRPTTSCSSGRCTSAAGRCSPPAAAFRRRRARGALRRSLALRRRAWSGIDWRRFARSRSLRCWSTILRAPPTRLRAVSEHTRPRARRRAGGVPVRARPGRGAGRARRVRRGRRGHRAARTPRRRAAPSLGARGHSSLRRRASSLRPGRTTSGRPSRSKQAAADFAALGLAFDHARTLLGLGRARRRARKWGAARRTLEQAASRFDELGSPGWADRGAGRARAHRSTQAAADRRADADRAARGGARDPGAVQQGDRAGAVRHRQHRRGAPVARLREARHPLARPARARIRRAPVADSKDSGFPRFRPGEGGRTVEP